MPPNPVKAIKGFLNRSPQSIYARKNTETVDRKITSHSLNNRVFKGFALSAWGPGIAVYGFGLGLV